MSSREVIILTRKRLTREESRKLTRKRLLDAAEEVFAQQGFHGASVEKVAEEAGYSKGAVYSNFGGKEDLFFALLDRRMDNDPEFWENVESAQDLNRDFARELEEERTWNLLTMEFLLYAIREDGAREKLAERQRVFRHELAEFFEKLLQEEGGKPPMPAEHLSWLVNALGTGLAVQAYIDPEAYPEGLYGKAVMHLLEGQK